MAAGQFQPLTLVSFQYVIRAQKEYREIEFRESGENFQHCFLWLYVAQEIRKLHYEALNLFSWLHLAAGILYRAELILPVISEITGVWLHDTIIKFQLC